MNRVNESPKRAVCFQRNFMERLRVTASLGLAMLNDTGTLMYDMVAPFPHSFLYMVNSSSAVSE